MEKIKLNDRMNLIYLPNSQLKVAIISMYFRRPLSREEATLNSLIPDVLKCGSQRLNTETEIDKELQGLYGAKVSFNTMKVGEKHIIAFKMLMCSDKYLPEPILESCLKLLKEVIYEPYKVDGGFFKDYVEREKEVLKEDILAKINSKGSYAVEKCVTNMCKDEAFSVSSDGYIEDLENINELNLYEHYQRIITTSPIDIVVVGDLDLSKIKIIVERDFIPENKPLTSIDEDFIIRDVKTVNYVKETMDVSQGKLVMGYRTGVTANDANYYDLLLYSNVLGSGVSSKLFRNVREKHSLCYSIGATLEKFKGLMFINSGIEVSNYQKALDLISQQVDAMVKGDITDEELNATKLYIMSNLRSIKDSPLALSDFYFSQNIQGNDDTVDQVIENISNVTKAGIVSVAKNIKLDTVYFLTNEEVVSENN